MSKSTTSFKKMEKFLVLFMLLCKAATTESAQTIDNLCYADCTSSNGGNRTCVYEFALDVYAGETGYYTVKGCTGTQPTLAMEANVEYVFLQHDITNWMHPLGFGYFPDGAHKDVAELEPEINPYNDTCVTDSSCQTPMYYRDNTFLGGPDGDEGFGLDLYEPEFQSPRQDWAAAGNYSVRLVISDPATADIFYFCHIHDNMSGRIKVLDGNNNPRQDTDTPALGYQYDEISEFDETCGSHNIEPFRNVSNACPDMTFLCGVDDNGDNLFGQCMQALDCAMHVEMRVDISSNPVETFMHQMIPHHRNAVNMAKVLLKSNSLQETDNDPDGEIEDMLWDIINTQNKQITMMRAWLKTRQENPPLCQHESEDDYSDTSPPTSPPTLDTSSLESDVRTSNILIGLTLAFVLITLVIAGIILAQQARHARQDTASDASKPSSHVAQA